MSWIRDHAASAAANYGLLERSELVQLGVGNAAIDHALGRGQVLRVHLELPVPELHQFLFFRM